MKSHVLLCASIVAASATVTTASTITQPLYDASWTATGTSPNGDARGIYFTPEITFTTQSIGVFGNLVDGRSYEFQVYFGNGQGVGSTLGSASSAFVFTAPVAGSQWNDTAAAFTFTAAVDYILLFRVTDTAAHNLPTNADLPLFTNLLWNNTADDTDFGLVVGRAGRSSVSAADANAYIPQLRLIIPEPAGLFIAGIAGIVVCRRRR